MHSFMMEWDGEKGERETFSEPHYKNHAMHLFMSMKSFENFFSPSHSFLLLVENFGLQGKSHRSPGKRQTSTHLFTHMHTCTVMIDKERH